MLTDHFIGLHQATVNTQLIELKLQSIASQNPLVYSGRDEKAYWIPKCPLSEIIYVPYNWTYFQFWADSGPLTKSDRSCLGSINLIDSTMPQLYIMYKYANCELSIYRYITMKDVGGKKNTSSLFFKIANFQQGPSRCMNLAVITVCK